MASTGTTTFALSLNEMAEEAMERASGGTRELRSGYDFRTARRSLNMLLIEWANRGINLWTLESGTIPLLAGVAEYDIPADTVDLVETLVRQNNGVSATQTDLTISRISVSTYAAIPNKLTTGRPLQLLVRREVVQPKVLVWPLPQDNSYTCLLYTSDAADE